MGWGSGRRRVKRGGRFGGGFWTPPRRRASPPTRRSRPRASSSTPSSFGAQEPRAPLRSPSWGESVAPAAKRDELVRTATVLGLKATRIASYLSDVRPSDAWDADAVPNVLLVELLIRQVREGLVLTPAGEPAMRALEELNRIIEPLLARLDRPRALLGKLVERATAASPFCIAVLN